MSTPFVNDSRITSLLSRYLPRASNELVSVISYYVSFTKEINGKLYFNVSKLFNKLPPEHELLINPTVAKRNILIRFLLVEAKLSTEKIGDIFNISPKLVTSASKLMTSYIKIPVDVRQFYTSLILLLNTNNSSKLTTGTNEEKINQLFIDELNALIERKCKAMSEIDEVNEQLINTYKTNKVAIKNMFNSYYLKALDIYNERLEAFGDLSIKELETQKYSEEFKMIYDKTNKQWQHHSLFLRDAKDIFTTDILTEDLRMAINDLGTKWIKLDMMICNWSVIYEQSIAPQVCTAGAYNEKVYSIDLNRRVPCQS